VDPRRWSLATIVALVGGAAFWWASLYPTLIPRDWPAQAVVSGVCAAIGFGIGTLIGRGLQRLGARAAEGSRGSWIGLGIAVFVATVLIAGAVVWPAWQNDLRDLVQMPHVGPLDSVLALLVGVLVAVALVVLGGWTARGIAALHRFVSRFIPGWLAAPATLALLLALVAVLGGQVIWRGLTLGASAMFAPADADTNPGTVRPSSATVSGSPRLARVVGVAGAPGT
jgi:uncharacterized membrane protein